MKSSDNYENLTEEAKAEIERWQREGHGIAYGLHNLGEVARLKAENTALRERCSVLQAIIDSTETVYETLIEGDRIKRLAAMTVLRAFRNKLRALPPMEEESEKP